METETEKTQYAPIWRRLASSLYDSFLILAISMAYGAIATLVAVVISGAEQNNYQPMFSSHWYQLGWLLSVAFFFIFFWWRAGQTVGMKAWRIKVIKDDGTKLSLADACIRCVVAITLPATLLLGYLFCLTNKKRKTLHDASTNSVVVVLPK